MKYYISTIVLILALLSTLEGAEDIREMWKNPTPYLNEIRRGIASEDRGLESDNVLAEKLQAMSYAINQEILSAESPLWQNPTPERKRVITKWGLILEPYSKELTDLALGAAKTRERAAKQARSLLDFAAPTDQFAENIRSYLDKNDPSKMAAAIDLLFEHRLLNDVDKEILRDSVYSAKSEEEKRRGLMGLSAYGMTDGLEVAREILRSEPKFTNYEQLIKQYRDALNFLINMGPMAESLLADLDLLISRMEKSQVGMLNKLEYARDVVTGKQIAQARFPRNGSGLPLTPIATKPPQQGDHSETAPPANLPMKSNRKTVNNRDSSLPSPSLALSALVLFVLSVAGWAAWKINSLRSHKKSAL